MTRDSACSQKTCEFQMHDMTFNGPCWLLCTTAFVNHVVRLSRGGIAHDAGDLGGDFLDRVVGRAQRDLVCKRGTGGNDLVL